MNNAEFAKFIAEFIMNTKETVLEAIEKEDISIIEDEAFEYINECF